MVLEKGMTTHSSILAWKIPWTEEPGRLQSMGSQRVTWLSLHTCLLPVVKLEKEIATHSSILDWKIPWTEEPSRLQSMGSQRVGHGWAINTFTIFQDHTSFGSAQSLSHAQLSMTPCTAACQASLSITNSWNLLKLMSIELVVPSNHLPLYCPLLLLPSILPSIGVFSNEWDELRK